VAPQQGPIIVRGMGRYLELKEMARRQTEERKEREQKVIVIITMKLFINGIVVDVVVDR